MDDNELERMLRRVVREELHRYHSTGGKPHTVYVQAPRRGAVAYGDEGMQNIRRVLEYEESIDPDNTMPKDELKHLLRMKFPEFDW